MECFHVTCHPPCMTHAALPMPEDLPGIYQLCAPVQLGTNSVALFLNISQEAAGSNDVEIGNDLAVVSDPALRKIDSLMQLNRTQVLTRPGSDAPVRVLPYPIHGAFVPAGSGLPHAGTGFGLSLLLDRPCQASGVVSGDTGTVKTLGRYELMQFETDGKAVKVISRREILAEEFLPDWYAVGMGMSMPIPDGDGFLGSLTAMRPGQNERGDAVSGVVRWSYGSEGWFPKRFIPVSPVISTEPSVVRAPDGALLYTMRVAGHIPAEGRDAVAREIAQANAARIWRSADNGETWSLVLNVPETLAAGPRELLRSASGRIYFAGNALPPGTPAGEYTHMMRSELRLWRLAEDCSKLDGSTVILAPMIAPGADASPDKLWIVDHPHSAVCTLADGKAHTLLGFRMLSFNEILGQIPATAYTGSYLEELLEESNEVPAENL